MAALPNAQQLFQQLGASPSAMNAGGSIARGSSSSSSGSNSVLPASADMSMGMSMGTGMGRGMSGVLASMPGIGSTSGTSGAPTFSTPQGMDGLQAEAGLVPLPPSNGMAGIPYFTQSMDGQIQQQDPLSLLQAHSTWVTPSEDLPIKGPIIRESASMDVDMSGELASAGPSRAPWAALVVLMPSDNAAVTPRSREIVEEIIKPLSDRILEVLALSQGSSAPASNSERKVAGKKPQQQQQPAVPKPELEIGTVLYGTRRTSRRAGKAKAEDDPSMDWEELLSEKGPYEGSALRKMPLMPSETFFSNVKNGSTSLSPQPLMASVKENLGGGIDVEDLLFGVEDDWKSGQIAEMDELWYDLEANAGVSKSGQDPTEGLLFAEGLVAAIEVSSSLFRTFCRSTDMESP
jgi:hypothetical protein